MTKVKRRVLLAGAAVLCSVMAIGTGGATASAAPAIPGLPPLPPLPSISDILGPLAPQPPTGPRLAKSFATLEKSMRKSGRVGLVVTPVGSDVGQSFGGLKTGRAWSTMKVPVSLAAERHGGSTVTALENKAITFSDNDAAGALWGVMGGGRASADAVTAVLREGHDTATRVSSEADAPPSYPGYTQWALVDQSRFAAHLPCMPGSTHILDLMGHVAANQQWGVAKLRKDAKATSAVKGGWGPVDSTTGKYIVRQVAVISTARGQLAVSMAALPRSGSFTDGQQMLNRVVDWMGRNMAFFPMGRCGL